MALTRFFLEIIYFMKTLTKLVGSNMKVHGFFQLGRDTTGAWSVFHFLNSSQMPRTTAARIDQIHKIFTFSFFWIFFILLRVSSRLTSFLKMCQTRFSGSGCPNFGKSMISDTSTNWRANDPGRYFSTIGGGVISYIAR